MYVEYGPIKLWLAADEIGITSIDFVDQVPNLKKPHSELSSSHLKLAADELIAYFKGELTDFSVPIHFLKGTVFQQKVWQGLLTIPYGEIKNYQDIAILVDSPKAQQAVGQANRNNPIPIIVPCHRVIGKNGKLTGYSGNSPEGLIIKQFLLDIEKERS